MNETVTDIETAIREALAAVPALAKPVIRDIILLDTLLIPELEDIASRGPIIGVIGLRGRYLSDGVGMTSVADGSGEFAVVVLDRNLRSGVAGKSGAVGEAGIWNILQICRETLHHRPDALGIDIRDIAVTRYSMLFASRNACGVEADITVGWRNT